jgi:hypothetical protein
MIKKISSLFVLCFIVTILPTFSLTQEEAIKMEQDMPSLVRPSVSANTPGLVSCFDYYKFGSVQVDLESTQGEVTPGKSVLFKGSLRNQNSYPVVNGQVYAKVFLKKNTAASLHQNGYDVVDQFFVTENVSIDASTSTPLSFTWKVPNNAENGEYQVVFFFTSAHRYNLLGLSFTDDVVGNRTSFFVKGEQNNTPVFFNKNTVKINNNQYRFAAFAPHFKKDEDVVISLDVLNPKKKSSSATVTWELYTWDSLRKDSLLDSFTENIELSTNGTKRIQHSFSKKDNSVSYVVVTLRDGESKSILGIRYVREGIEETRINFPSILSYPLKKDVENTMFSCLHATNVPVVHNGTLKLTLRDSQGEEISSYTYSGDVTGNMMGVKSSFVPKKDIATFSLTAQLLQNGIVQEEVTQQYDCAAIGKWHCPQGVSITNISSKDSLSRYALYMVLLLLLGLGAYGGVVRFKKGATPTAPDTTNN